MQTQDKIKPVKRLSATLPDPLAVYVSAITGKGGDYETPSEFVRDLIRRHMERTQEQEKHEVETMLMQSLSENDYSLWTDDDMQELRNMAKE
jgi:Arc/MetJ-type ribon-helix-helix transcriptional regulator